MGLPQDEKKEEKKKKKRKEEEMKRKKKRRKEAEQKKKRKGEEKNRRKKKKKERKGELVSWYFEPSQPQRVTSWLETMVNLSPIYSARKSSNHKLSIDHKISHDTNLHKTKHTQTSDTKFSKN